MARHGMPLLDALFGHDVFISYAWEDGRDYAFALAEALRARGLDSFLDRRALQAGDPLTDEIRGHVRGASALVIVGTRAAMRSPWVAEELEIFKRTRRTVVPIVFADARGMSEPLAVALSAFIYADEEAGARTPSAEVLTKLVDAFDFRRALSRRAAFYRGLAIVGGVIALAAFALAGLARHQANRARALEERLTRLEDRAAALRALDEAVRDGDPLVGARAIARARSLSDGDLLAERAAREWRERMVRRQLPAPSGGTALAWQGSRLLAVGRSDGKIDLWDARAWKRAQLLDAGATVRTLAFDGALLAAGTDHGGVRLFDVDGGSARAPLALGRDEPVEELAFADDKLYARLPSALMVIDPDKNSFAAGPRCTASPVGAFDVSDDAAILACPATHDIERHEPGKPVARWSLEGVQRLLYRYDGGEALLADGHWATLEIGSPPALDNLRVKPRLSSLYQTTLAASTVGGAIEWIDLGSSRRLARLHTGRAPSALALAPGGEVLLAVAFADEPRVAILSHERARERTVWAPFGTERRLHVVMNPFLRMVAAVERGRLYVNKIDPQRVEFESGSFVECKNVADAEGPLAWTTDGEVLAAGVSGNRVSIHGTFSNPDCGPSAARVEAGAPIVGLAWMGIERRLALATGSAVTLHDLNDYKNPTSRALGIDKARAIAWTVNVDPPLLAVARGSDPIVVWSSKDGSKEERRAPIAVDHVAWRRGEKRRELLAAGRDGVVLRLIDEKTQRRLREPDGRRLVALDWSSDGERIALGFSDGTIDVVDGDSGVLVMRHVTSLDPLSSVSWHAVRDSLLAIGARAVEIDHPDARTVFREVDEFLAWRSE